MIFATFLLEIPLPIVPLDGFELGLAATGLWTCYTYVIESCAVPAIPAESDSKGRYTMGEFSPFHWLVVLAIVVLLFGGK